MSPLFSWSCSPKKAGFTIIELVVVVVILAILSTAGYIAYQGWVSRSRDGARIENLNAMYLAIKLRRGIQESIPKPSIPRVHLLSGSASLATQGVAGHDVTSLLNVRGQASDPLDGKFYTYVVNKTGRFTEFATLLENDSSARHLAYVPFLPQAYAVNGNYSDRYPYVTGDQIAVLFGTDEHINTPIQEIIPTTSTTETSLDLASESTGTYVAISSNPEQKVAKGLPRAITGNAKQISTAFSNSYNCWPGMVAMSGSCIEIPEDSCPVSSVQNPLYTTGGMAFSLTQDLLHNQYLDISAQTGAFLNGDLVGTGTYTLIVKCYKGELQFSRSALRLRSTCESGYIEDPVSFTCVANTCRGMLPEFSSGTSTDDDPATEWHYSETPGPCTFECATNYAYSGASRSCVANPHYAFCESSFDSNTHKIYFNELGSYQITQTWDIQGAGSGAWSPGTGSTFNEFPQENTCQYRCANGYHSENFGTTCEPNMRHNVACQGSLQSHMVYANASNSYTVDQIWISGTTWSPIVGSFQAFAATGTCNFTCEAGYHTEDFGQTCILNARTKNFICSAPPDGTIYGHSGSFNFDQTWTGAVMGGSWTPEVSTVGAYGGSGCTTNSTNCTYCCAPGYTFSEALQICALRTEIETCPTFSGDDHKIYATSSFTRSYTSAWSGALDRFWPLPKSIDHPDYENNIGYNPTYSPHAPFMDQHCYYKCADDYHSEDGGVTCISNQRTAACVPATLGGDRAYYNNQTSYSIPQYYNGAIWLPTLAGSYVSTSSSGSCDYSCRQWFHSENNGITCESNIRSKNCTGFPTNSTPNSASGIFQTWGSGGWSPTDVASYNTTESSSECRFVCRYNYDWNVTTGACEARKITSACTGLPVAAHWNTASGIIQTWNGNDWYPAPTGSWNQTGSTTECRFDCDVGHAYNPALNICSCLIAGTFFTQDFSWVPYDERLWYTSLDLGTTLSDSGLTSLISVQFPNTVSGSVIPLLGKAWSRATGWMDMSAQDEHGDGGVFFDTGSLIVEGTAWSQNAGWVGISGYQLDLDQCPYRLVPANDFCITPETVEYSGATFYMDQTVSVYNKRPAVTVGGSFSFGGQDTGGEIRAEFEFSYAGNCTPVLHSYTPVCSVPGEAFYGTPSSPQCGNCITHIQKQGTHALFQKYDGSAWAYGDNTFGQLGVEGLSYSVNPVPLTISGSFSFPEAAYTPRSSFINVSNTPYLAGENSGGMLLVSAPSSITTFIAHPSLSAARSVYRDENNVYFVDTQSKLWIWWDNSFNQIGNNATNEWQSYPIDSLVANARRAVGWSGTTIILYNDGSIWGYGSDQYNELNGFPSPTPVQLMTFGFSNQDLVASRGTFFVLTHSGTVMSWGKNEYGESGQGTVWPVFALEIPWLDHITQIMAGDGFFMALRNDGTLFTMGRNDRGQLWNGSAGFPVSTPQVIDVGSPILRIFWPGLVLRDDKNAFAWGPNESGQNGYGFATDYYPLPYNVGILNSIWFCEEVLN